MQVLTHSAGEMYTDAARVVGGLAPREAATVVALSGDLGAGKTTFAQGVARALGVAESVTSPTFVIQKIYTLENKPFDRLVHMDAYRLHGAHDVQVLGWDELMQDPKNLILIEWPEQVGGAIPKNALHISFRFIDESTREITYE